MGLADSFGIMGGGTNYHFLLEKRLLESGRSVELVNFSDSEYSPEHEAAILRRFGVRYRPDLILHGFFVGNDFMPGSSELWSYRQISIPASEGWSAYLPWNFTLLSWLRRRYRVRREMGALERAVASGIVPGGGSFRPETFLKIERSRLEICRLGPQTKRRWEEGLREVRKIREAARTLGAEYAMVILPDELQVNAALLRELKESHGVVPSEFDLDGPQRFLMNDCAKNRVPCLDLLPLFRKSGERRSLYLSRDTHFNLAGNERASRAISDFLIREGLLKRAGNPR